MTHHAITPILTGMSSATRQILDRQMVEIRRLFAGPLATRLGRPLEEVRDEGLGAFDFKVDEQVELTLCDGSTMSLLYAFFVLEPEQSRQAPGTRARRAERRVGSPPFAGL